MSKQRPDMERIAKSLGATRRGQVKSRSGYFGALELAAEVVARFRTPAGGGRSTSPEWTEKRLVPLSRGTLDRLSELAEKVGRAETRVEPMQIAALLLERSLKDLDASGLEDLVPSPRH